MSLSVEESNFLRFYYLNLKVASKAARRYFDYVHPPSGLANELAFISGTLKRRTFITKPQLQILYPSPASNVTSSDFDTTLIVCLLRNMKPCETAPVTTGWDILPHPADISTGADLARIKWYRNKLAHDGDGKLSLADFSQCWGDLECAIGRLGGTSMQKEAQSVQHIVLDKSLSDILNKLHNCEREFHNYHMSQEEHTSKISYLQSVIDKQSSITKEQETKLKRLNDSLQKGETESKELYIKLSSDYKRIMNKSSEEVKVCKNEMEKTEIIYKRIQEKAVHEEKRVNDLIRKLVTKNDIRFQVIDEQLIQHNEQLIQHNEQLIQNHEQLIQHDEQIIQHDEQLIKHDEQLIKHKEQFTKNDEQFKTFDEGLTTHGENFATCMKAIGDIKGIRYSYREGGSKQKRLEDDTKVLIGNDIREDTFVTTEAVTVGLLLLKQNGVLLITGCPGTGKSRISRHVLHMYCTGDTLYKCIKLDTLDDWEDINSQQDNMVVLLDDIFGETNCTYNKEKDKILDKIHAYVCKGNIKVIITIRDSVKRQCQEVFYSNRLFKFDFIDLNSDRYGLSLKEKRNILRKYMKSVHQLDYTDDGEFVDNNGVTILNTIEVWKITEENPVKGFPLAVYQFVHNAKYFHLGSQFFDRPTESMLEELNEVRRKGRDHQKFLMHYAVMVYTAINGNCINPQDSSIVREVKNLVETIYGTTMKLNKCDISDTVNELKGSYLISIPNQRSYRFHHPTLHESVILSFAQMDEEHFKDIIPLLSWSFIQKMVKPETYIEKEGEVVLGIPTTSYKLLTEKLVDIYMEEMRKDIKNAYVFVSNISYTDLFKQHTSLLLTYLLEVLEIRDNEDIDMKYKVDDFNSFEVSIKGGNFFLANLLMSVAKNENQLEMYNIVLQNVNDKLTKTSNDYVTTDYFQAAIMSSVYGICSTKDATCVKATLNLVKKIKMPILLDQSIDLIKIGFTSDLLERYGYSFIGSNCIFLQFCIWKAYEAYNVSVLKYLLSLYNGTSFDLNSFLKLVYSSDWVERSPSLTFRSLKWMIELFKDQDLVDTDVIFRTASRYQLFDTVQYLVSRGNTFNAISCLKICLNESDKVVHQDFFKLFFSKIDITSPEMKSIIKSILQKPCVPDYMCETLLPVCIDNGEILDAACKEGHLYISKLIMEKSRNVSIQSALISACKEKRKIYRHWFELHHKDEKLEIVKYIVGKYGYTQFDLKAMCQEAYCSKNFKIIEWFVQNVDVTLLDSFYKVLSSALVEEDSNILEYLTNKTELAILEKNLKYLTKHCKSGCSTKILQLVSIIWDRTDDKETINIQEIVDLAYENNCIELLMWIYENCNSYIFIDGRKLLMLACKKGRIDEAKWVLQNFEKKTLDIDEGELFLLTCAGMSDFMYQTETISMINWVLNNFQIKPDFLKAEVFKLLSGKMDIFPFEKYEDFFYLIVSLIKGCFNSLNTEDMEEIMNKSLEGGFYDLVIWILKTMSFYSFNEQKILNRVCKNADIETIMVLNKSFSSLNMNHAMIRLMINAKTGIEDYQRVDYLDQLWTNIDHESLDMRKIVSTVCKKGPIANILKWILLNLPYDKKSINKILISCSQKENSSLVRYIFREVNIEYPDLLAAFHKACFRPRGSYGLYHADLWIGGLQKSIGVVDFLFEKVIPSDISIFLEELFEKIKSYDVKLYFLVKGYCRNIDMKNLLNEACRHGHVKLVQWILENIEHKELDIESACLETSKCSNNELRYQCVTFMRHVLQDSKYFRMENELKSTTDTSPDMPDIFCDMNRVSLNTIDFSEDMSDMSDDSDMTDISNDMDELIRFLSSQEIQNG